MPPRLPQGRRQGICSRTHPAGRTVLRIQLDLSIEEAVARATREPSLNMSRLAEAAIAEAARLERNRRWREENREALETYAREIERDGLALPRFRSF